MRTKWLEGRRIWWTVGALVLFAALALGAARFVAYSLYPLPYRAEVVRWSREHGHDPLFIAAVARVESKWQITAVSRKGARGLMQVMPETGEWAAGRLGIKNFEADRLYDPSTNLRIGCWYIDSLRRELGGDTLLAMAAYNGGVSNVKRWLAQSEWTGEGSTIDQIPFGETRDFLRRIMTDYLRYRRLYHGDGRPKWYGPDIGIWFFD